MMGWLKKLSNSVQDNDSSKIEFPIQFELIPEKLFVRIYLNDIPSKNEIVPCWTYITDGLHRQNQKELIFSLRRHPDQNVNSFPHAPFNIFSDIYKFAELGRVVDVGDISEFATSSFLEHKGLLYIKPDPSQLIEDLDDALTILMLTAEEIEAVKLFGPTRVMARFGQREHYYPCPPWSDQKQLSLIFKASIQQSILTKVPCLWRRGIKVCMENNTIIMRLLSQISDNLHEQLNQIQQDSAPALLTNLDYSANGCLVWEPGIITPQPYAITPPDSNGSRLCGCFILFVPHQPKDGGKLFEDGFMLMLTDTSWESVKQAIATNTTITIPATDQGMNFQLSWIQTTYLNPIDGIAYQVDDGWETYLPTNLRTSENTGTIQTKHIILLIPELNLRKRVEIKEFASYTRLIEETVEQYLTSFTPLDIQELIVEFEVWQGGKVEVRTSSNLKMTNETFQNLCATLADLPKPKVLHNSIRFQIVFSAR